MTIKSFEAKIADYVNGPAEQDYVIESRAEMMYIVGYIRGLDYNYYDDSVSSIPDHVYDRIMSGLITYEKDNPDLALAHSPTCRVPEVRNDFFAKVKHTNRMQSILTVTSNHDKALEKFVASLMTESGNVKGEIIAELKYDGLAAELIYRDGYLETISTRGDGTTGEDVTHNQLMIDNIPRFLTYEDILPGSQQWNEFFASTIISVYGEVIMLNSIFKKILAELESNSSKTYATARHAASGLLRTHKPYSTMGRERPLTFKPYNLWISGTNNELLYPGVSGKYNNRMKLCNDLGIKYRTLLTELELVSGVGQPKQTIEKEDKQIHLDANGFNESIVNGTGHLLQYYSTVAAARDSLDFGIDGVVFKANYPGVAMNMSGSARVAAGHIALKFKPKTADSAVIDVINHVAKSGKVTPVARIDPVIISGVTIARINLFNYSEIRRKGIKQHSRIVVSRAGDTIPQIERVIENLDYGVHDMSIPEPTECPCCETQLVKKDTFLYCPNTTGCTEQIVGTIVHWGSRDCINIYGLSDWTARTLVEKCGVKSIADLYIIDWQSKAVNHFTAARIKSLNQSLSRQITVDGARIVAGLGIPLVGSGAADTLLEYMCQQYGFCGFYGMFVKLVEDYGKDPTPLKKEMGEETAESIIKYLTSDVGARNIEVVSRHFMIDLSYYINNFEEH